LSDFERTALAYYEQVITAIAEAALKLMAPMAVTIENTLTARGVTVG
jgi:hypothetical protein